LKIVGKDVQKKLGVAVSVYMAVCIGIEELLQLDGVNKVAILGGRMGQLA